MESRVPVSRVITSGNQTLSLDPAPPEIIEKLGRWPKGFIKGNLKGRDQYVLVMQDKEGEVAGLRFHFGYYKEKKHAEDMLSVCRLLLAATLQRCRQFDFRGILVSCPYMVSTDDCSYAGYVLFIHSEHAFTFESCPESFEFWDKLFGPGASSMLAGFLITNNAVWKAAGLWDRTIADLDVAYRSQCGALALDYILVDQDIVCIKSDLHDDNPILTRAADAGLQRIFWLPILPATSTE
jgi:hypothetical protein